MRVASLERLDPTTREPASSPWRREGAKDRGTEAQVTRRGKASLLALTAAAALGAVLLLRSGSGKQAIPAQRCDPSSCAPVACDPGFHAKVSPDACCPQCVPDAERDPEPPAPAPKDPCARQRCSPCPTGMRPEKVEGECCPRCVAADQKACEQGRNRYEDRYAEFEAKLRGCASDDECMVASFGDACRASCPLPLNKAGLGSVVSELREAAALHCQDCAPEPFECPRLNADSARCVSGRCEFVLPPQGGTSR